MANWRAREKKYSDDPFHVINTIIIPHISLSRATALCSFQPHFTCSNSSLSRSLTTISLWLFWLLPFRRTENQLGKISMLNVKLANTHGKRAHREDAARAREWCAGQMLVKHLKINRGWYFSQCMCRCDDNAYSCFYINARAAIFFSLIHSVGVVLQQWVPLSFIMSFCLRYVCLFSIGFHCRLRFFSALLFSLAATLLPLLLSFKY